MTNMIASLIGMLLPFLVLAVFFCLGFKTLAQLFGRKRSGKIGNARQQAITEVMPIEMTLGRLFLSEKDIVTVTPRPMHGRVDQVYEYRGHLCLVDTKVRGKEKIYETDIIQLSVYKTILENSGNPQVLPYGYIRLVCYGVRGRIVHYKKVLLFTEHQISELWDIYKQYA